MKQTPVGAGPRACPSVGAGGASWRLPLYRVGQFFRGLAAQVSPGEQHLVAELLPAPAQTLFFCLPLDAQRHSLNVLFDVQAAGTHDPDLAVAALLHDVGKVRLDFTDENEPDRAGQVNKLSAVGLWLRGPMVLMEAWSPSLVAGWASSEPGHGWRHLLYLHLHHPRLGAAAARACGCSPTACWLIEHHQDKAVRDGSPQRLELLRVLQWADNRN
jgi:hypothetical protein